MDPGDLLAFLVLSWVLCMGFGGAQGQYSSVVSRYSERELWLKPYDWTYLRVELPPSFSAATMNFMTNVDIDREKIKDLPLGELPIICLKEGNPPIPDLSDTYLDISNFLSTGSFGDANNLSDVGQCVPFQKNMTITLTNEQISPGVWYIGYFNGLGPSRTQSKMISRGKAYTVSTGIVIQGCPMTNFWGPYCNQTISMIYCSQPSIYNNSSLLDLNMHNLEKNEMNKEANQKLVDSNSSFLAAESLIMCNNLNETSCIGLGEQKFYFLDVINVASQFTISSLSDLGNSSGVLLMCYVRYNAMPLLTLHDYSGDISMAPLIIRSPKIGRWYIAVEAVNQTVVNGLNFCFSLDWQVTECYGKAGTNCSWESYILQRIPKRGPAVPYESYFLPSDGLSSVGSFHFILEPLLSNSSIQLSAWTYFFLDVPQGAAGAFLHIQFKSDVITNYELYSKFGGLPSNETWDYYSSSSNSSNNTAFLALNDSKGGSIDFYILYAREGTWGFGLKHPPNGHSSQTSMSISLEGCHKGCNYNGQCRYSVDESGLTFYSYCACNRDHGGFDCSNELVTHKGHVWQSIFLIASNAAAILPAFWALRQKAFAEWVLYTSSGISSGLYHACDVGTWCILSFHVLQFMDFWLSFMAVVSTFIYMATIDEASKRAIHTAVFILTALLAATGATRSSNIGIVIAIGSLGLFIGWLVEFSTALRFTYFSRRIDFNVSRSWQSIRSMFSNLIKVVKKRFPYGTSPSTRRRSFSCAQLAQIEGMTVKCPATSWPRRTPHRDQNREKFNTYTYERSYLNLSSYTIIMAS
ncbi:Transmembrane protein 8B [Ananas comosus]|uniref:Transmembrane protein 8B n=1 Tax=Ananas comosus TaxID=4615 RepID=A0A199VHK6_ANACO|nr:Transmembrane protein 8B [Ananas comosus]